MNFKTIKGKTREYVLNKFGHAFTTEYGGDIWVYEFKKTWFRRKNVLIIEFDEDGIVVDVDKINADI